MGLFKTIGGAIKGGFNTLVGGVQNLASTAGGIANSAIAAATPMVGSIMNSTSVTALGGTMATTMGGQAATPEALAAIMAGAQKAGGAIKSFFIEADGSYKWLNIIGVAVPLVGLVYWLLKKFKVIR